MIFSSPHPKPPWFPDWTGETALIVASGPSAKKAKLDQLRGLVRCIAIKESNELAPWADVCYGCDAPFWRAKLGLQGFTGLKISFAKQLSARFPDIKLIEIDVKSDKIETDRPGYIGSGGNSGFQAVNLAVQFGATRILLVGFDMHDRSGPHWYGRALGQGRVDPAEHNFRRWRKAFDEAAPGLAESSVDVVNGSPISDLTCFKKATIEQAMEMWGLCQAA